MRHELADMQANLIGVINILNRLSSSLRIGVVAYKDQGEPPHRATSAASMQAPRSGRSWFRARPRATVAATTRSR
jgi:hypothetical protein